VNQSPEDVIKSHLENNGGQENATLNHLLTTFGVEEHDREGRAEIERALSAEGIAVEPPLRDLGGDEPLRLSLGSVEPEPSTAVIAGTSNEDHRTAVPQEEPGTAGAHPGGGTGPVSPPPGAQDAPGAGRRTPRVLVAVLVIALLAAAGGAAGYLLGKSGGEDLDAARASGERAGQREGAARGAERGYDQGFRQGRRAGYKETYKKTYDKTYEAELKKAGLSPESVQTGR